MVSRKSTKLYSETQFSVPGLPLHSFGTLSMNTSMSLHFHISKMEIAIEPNTELLRNLKVT